MNLIWSIEQAAKTNSEIPQIFHVVIRERVRVCAAGCPQIHGEGLKKVKTLLHKGSMIPFCVT